MGWRQEEDGILGGVLLLLLLACIVKLIVPQLLHLCGVYSVKVILVVVIQAQWHAVVARSCRRPRRRCRTSAAATTTTTTTRVGVVGRIMTRSHLLLVHRHCHGHHHTTQQHPRFDIHDWKFVTGTVTQNC